MPGAESELTIQPQAKVIQQDGSHIADAVLKSREDPILATSVMLIFARDGYATRIRHNDVSGPNLSTVDPQWLSSTTSAIFTSAIFNSKDANENFLKNMDPLIQGFFRGDVQLARLAFCLTIQRSLFELNVDSLGTLTEDINARLAYQASSSSTQQSAVIMQTVPIGRSVSMDNICISDTRYAIRFSSSTRCFSTLTDDGVEQQLLLGENGDFIRLQDVTIRAQDGTVLADNTLRMVIKDMRSHATFEGLEPFLHDRNSMRQQSVEHGRTVAHYPQSRLQLPLLLPSITTDYWFEIDRSRSVEGQYVVTNPSYAHVLPSPPTGNVSLALGETGSVYTLINEVCQAVIHYEHLCYRRLLHKSLSSCTDEEYNQFVAKVANDVKNVQQFYSELQIILRFPIPEKRWQLACILVQQASNNQMVTLEQAAIQAEVHQLFQAQYQVNYAHLKEDALFPSVLSTFTKSLTEHPDADDKLLVDIHTYSKRYPAQMNAIGKVLSAQEIMQNFAAICKMVEEVSRKPERDLWLLVENPARNTYGNLNECARGIAILSLGFHEDLIDFFRKNSEQVYPHQDLLKKHPSIIARHQQFVADNLEHLSTRKNIFRVEEVFQYISNLAGYFPLGRFSVLAEETNKNEGFKQLLSIAKNDKSQNAAFYAAKLDSLVAREFPGAIDEATNQYIQDLALQTLGFSKEVVTHLRQQGLITNFIGFLDRHPPGLIDRIPRDIHQLTDFFRIADYMQTLNQATLFAMVSNSNDQNELILRPVLEQNSVNSSNNPLIQDMAMQALGIFGKKTLLENKRPAFKFLEEVEQFRLLGFGADVIEQLRVHDLYDKFCNFIDLALPILTTEIPKEPAQLILLLQMSSLDNKALINLFENNQSSDPGDRKDNFELQRTARQILRIRMYSDRNSPEISTEQAGYLRVLGFGSDIIEQLRAKNLFVTFRQFLALVPSSLISSIPRDLPELMTFLELISKDRETLVAMSTNSASDEISSFTNQRLAKLILQITKPDSRPRITFSNARYFNPFSAEIGVQKILLLLANIDSASPLQKEELFISKRATVTKFLETVGIQDTPANLSALVNLAQFEFGFVTTEDRQFVQQARTFVFANLAHVKAHKQSIKIIDATIRQYAATISSNSESRQKLLELLGADKKNIIALCSAASNTPVESAAINTATYQQIQLWVLNALDLPISPENLVFYSFHAPFVRENLQLVLDHHEFFSMHVDILESWNAKELAIAKQPDVISMLEVLGELSENEKVALLLKCVEDYTNLSANVPAEQQIQIKLLIDILLNEMCRDRTLFPKMKMYENALTNISLPLSHTQERLKNRMLEVMQRPTGEASPQHDNPQNTIATFFALLQERRTADSPPKAMECKILIEIAIAQIIVDVKNLYDKKRVDDATPLREKAKEKEEIANFIQKLLQYLTNENPSLNFIIELIESLQKDTPRLGEQYQTLLKVGEVGFINDRLKQSVIEIAAAFLTMQRDTLKQEHQQHIDLFESMSTMPNNSAAALYVYYVLQNTLQPTEQASAAVNSLKGFLTQQHRRLDSLVTILKSNANINRFFANIVIPNLDNLSNYPNELCRIAAYFRALQTTKINAPEIGLVIEIINGMLDQQQQMRYILSSVKHNQVLSNLLLRETPPTTGEVLQIIATSRKTKKLSEGAKRELIMVGSLIASLGTEYEQDRAGLSGTRRPPLVRVPSGESLLPEHGLSPSPIAEAATVPVVIIPTLQTVAAARGDLNARLNALFNNAVPDTMSGVMDTILEPAPSDAEKLILLGQLTQIVAAINNQQNLNTDIERLAEFGNTSKQELLHRMTGNNAITITPQFDNFVQEIANRVLTVRSESSTYLKFYLRGNKGKFEPSKELKREIAKEISKLEGQIDELLTYHSSNPFAAKSYPSVDRALGDRERAPKLLSLVAQYTVLKSLVKSNPNITLDADLVFRIDGKTVGDLISNKATLSASILSLKAAEVGIHAQVIAIATTLGKNPDPIHEVQQITLDLESKTSRQIQKLGAEIATQELGFEVFDFTESSRDFLGTAHIFQVEPKNQTLMRRLNQQIDRVHLQLRDKTKIAADGKTMAHLFGYNSLRRKGILGVFKREEAWQNKLNALIFIKEAALQGKLCLNKKGELAITGNLEVNAHLRDITVNGAALADNAFTPTNFKALVNDNKNVGHAGFFNGANTSETNAVIELFQQYIRNNVELQLHPAESPNTHVRLTPPGH